MPNRHGPDTMKRYEKFADEIAELIRSGVLAPGCPRCATPAAPMASARPPCSRPTTCWKTAG